MRPDFETPLAQTIYTERYKHPSDGNWAGTAARVSKTVMGALYSAPKAQANLGQISGSLDSVYDLMRTKKFIPGGRYLYASRRDLHNVNNCLLLKAEDSREGWAELAYKSAMALMTGAGIGVWYGDVREAGAPIKRTGGVSSGPLALMEKVNNDGRCYIQGGNRRSAIWAGLSWSHPDVKEFITCKDWSEDVRALKAKDWKFPAPMDFTNISVTLDDEFFEAYKDDRHEKHSWACEVYLSAVSHMLKHGEPGFTVDLGEKKEEVLRNAPVAAGTHVLTVEGYKQVGEIVGVPQTIWTGKRWAPDVVFRLTKQNTRVVEVKMTGGRAVRCDPSHEFLVERHAGAGRRRKLVSIELVRASELKAEDRLHVSFPEKASQPFSSAAYTLGYIYGDGSFCGGKGGAELTLCTDLSKACLPFISGYRSVVEHDKRGYTRLYFSRSCGWQGRTKEAFPQLREADLPSFLAGLFDADGNYEPTQRSIRLSSKHRDFLCGTRRALEQLGVLSHVSKAGTSTYGKAQAYQLVIAAAYNNRFVSLIPTKRLSPEQRSPYREAYTKVNEVLQDAGTEDVYCADVKFPEHSFQAEGVIVSNCTEITSADDSDICNLGSLVLPQFSSPRDFGKAVREAVTFLTAGTLYSDVPYARVAEVRDKNRRLGLGLIGVHEFIIKHGAKYGSADAFELLTPYVLEYARALEYAHELQDCLGLSLSKGATAIAPNGTIGLIAESTPSADPLFAAAERRNVVVATPGGDTYRQHIVVDPTAARLVREGVDPDLIEDAHTLSLQPERRLNQQAFLQEYVDHAISGTINLPYPVTDAKEILDFADTLLTYLPYLRGVTVYPDGARAGQPRTPVDLKWALENDGTIFEGNEETCVGGVCGS